MNEWESSSKTLFTFIVNQQKHYELKCVGKVLSIRFTMEYVNKCQRKNVDCTSNLQNKIFEIRLFWHIQVVLWNTYVFFNMHEYLAINYYFTQLGFWVKALNHRSSFPVILFKEENYFVLSSLNVFIFQVLTLKCKILHI